METTGAGFSLSPPVAALALIAVGMALWAAYVFYTGKASMPVPSYAMGFRGGVEGFGRGVEGFGGAARGAGLPDCLRTSSEGAAHVALFDGKPCRTDGGAADLRELTQLVGKLACFKKDLLGPSHTVDATRKQEFVTSHDIEPIAETTGRCFSKSLSPRDLEISIEKWTTRGTRLVKRLSASFGLSPDDVEKAQALFQSQLRDITDLARTICVPSSQEQGVAPLPGPRDPIGIVTAESEAAETYTGYY